MNSHNPTPAMRKVLEVLAGNEKVRLSAHVHEGIGWICASLAGIYGYSGFHGRVKKATFDALLNRRWIKFQRERECGGQMGTLPDGKQGIVARSLDRDYVITAKGRAALKESIS